MFTEDIKSILGSATKGDVEMFFHKADYEGLVYYVQNWETPFDENEVYKRNMERPFFQALKFLEELEDACRDYIIDGLGYCVS